MRYRILLALALSAAAVAATVAGLPLSAATATDLVSAYVDGELPVADPASALWDRAIPVQVVMSGQAVARPMAPNPSVNAISVRSLTDGAWIAFRIDWDDATKSDGLGHDSFKDGVAIQFPAKGGQPFYCMGVVGDTVKILHWRSDFQADIERKQGPSTMNMNPNATPGYFPIQVANDPNYRPALGARNPIAMLDKASPVETLMAGGFGTLESSDRAEGIGWAAWNNGKWSAVIARPLVAADRQEAALKPDTATAVAFAVWEGGRGDISGKKTVSSWVTLGINPSAAVAAAAAAPEPGAVPAAAAAKGKPGAAEWTLIGVLWFLSLAAAWLIGQGIRAARREA